MGLNMCRQSIVDVPLDLKRDLEEFERTNDRSVLIKALRDQLLIARYDSAMLVEKARIAALETLIGRMSEMSDNMLIKIIEALTQIAEVDISSITGSGEVKRSKAKIRQQIGRQAKNESVRAWMGGPTLSYL